MNQPSAAAVELGLWLLTRKNEVILRTLSPTPKVVTGTKRHTSKTSLLALILRRLRGHSDLLRPKGAAP